MPNARSIRPFSRRGVLIAAGLAVASQARSAAQTQPTRTRGAPRFDVQRFVEDCRLAHQGTSDAQSAVQEVLARAIADPKAVLTGVGEPEKGGIQTLYRSADLTVLNIVWAPLMQLLPHEHRMWSLIGIYTGREDNIFWERRDGQVSAVKASAVAPGSVMPLREDVIHSVSNPIDKLTGAIHIYGGDFFATPRSEWDPETLTEREWNIKNAIHIFEQSNERFLAWRAHGACA